MKTRELIRLLQEADPTGEVECCVDNHDIWLVEAQGAGYDGALEILVRNPDLRPHYDVVGGIIRRVGKKVRIRPLSLEDAIWEARGKSFPIEIEVTDLADRVRFEQEVQKWRGESVQDDVARAQTKRD